MTTDVSMTDRFENKRNGEITDLQNYKYWFIHLRDNLFQVIDVRTNCPAYGREENGEFHVDEKHMLTGEDFGISDEDVKEDWDRFKTRPEYFVYSFSNMKGIDWKTDVEWYNDLLTGCLYHKLSDESTFPSVEDFEKAKARLAKCVNWLDSSGFYTSPASTKYHDAYVGGLLRHTLSVVYYIQQLLKTNVFGTAGLEDSILCALIHDWCKIGLYRSYTKNVKDDNGNWIQEIAYTYEENRKLALGHGVSSMYAGSKFFNLSYEQCLAIRWHMGEYNVADNEMNELHQANCNYPMVQLLQFADRLSITSYQ